MSVSGILFVVFFVSGIVCAGLELPTWICTLLLSAGGICISIATDKFYTTEKQFEQLGKRVEKLEKELQKRKDGADNE